MDNKVVIAIVVAAVVICAGAGVAILVGSMNNNESGVTEGVNYHGNGGKTSEGQTVMGSTSHDVIPNIFAYDGYKFVSWNTKADGSGTTYNPYGYIEYASGKTVDLYAIWAVDGSMLYASGSSNLVFYYGEVQVGFMGVDIPDSGPISVVAKVPTGATNLKNEVTEAGLHKITYDVALEDGKVEHYYVYIHITVGEEESAFEWEKDEDTIIFTINYEKSNIKISHNGGKIVTKT